MCTHYSVLSISYLVCVAVCMSVCVCVCPIATKNHNTTEFLHKSILKIINFVAVAVLLVRLKLSGRRKWKLLIKMRKKIVCKRNFWVVDYILMRVSFCTSAVHRGFGLKHSEWSISLHDLNFILVRAHTTSVVANSAAVLSCSDISFPPWGSHKAMHRQSPQYIDKYDQ